MPTTKSEIQDKHLANLFTGAYMQQKLSLYFMVVGTLNKYFNKKGFRVLLERDDLAEAIETWILGAALLPIPESKSLKSTYVINYIIDDCALLHGWDADMLDQEIGEIFEAGTKFSRDDYALADWLLGRIINEPVKGELAKELEDIARDNCQTILPWGAIEHNLKVVEASK
jgi:hypothetical protein